MLNAKRSKLHNLTANLFWDHCQVHFVDFQIDPRPSKHRRAGGVIPHSLHIDLFPKGAWGRLPTLDKLFSQFCGLHVLLVVLTLTVPPPPRT